MQIIEKYPRLGLKRLRINFNLLIVLDAIRFMPPVTIALTAPHTIPAKFITPFLALLSYTNQKIGTTFISMSTHYRTFDARNQGVKDALANGSDYLFFLDVDVLALPNTIEKLIAQEKDIVSGPYHMKEPPYRPLAWKSSGKEGVYELIEEITEKKVYEVDGIGGGCLLIKRKVLEKIGDPCFDFKLNGKNIGEDLFFSHRAKEEGFKIWYDNTVGDVRHYGAAVGFNDFQVWNYQIKAGNIKFNAKEEEVAPKKTPK